MGWTQFALGVFAGLLVGGPAVAAGDDDLPENAPENCTLCGGDPELMAASGILSHGGFTFATVPTSEVDEYSRETIYWVATEHIEIGLAADDYRIHSKERTGFREELTSLMEIFENINPKTRSIDPWMRVHLYALRMERAWDRFLDYAQVKDEDFPDGVTPRIIGEKYMGEGPFVGMKSKFEFLLLDRRKEHQKLLLDKYGLISRTAQRVHHVESGTLGLLTHLEEPAMRRDEALHAHFVFNLGHNMLDGYKHYSYDLPVWVKVGFAHLMGRGVSLEFNNFDGSEGSRQLSSHVEDWHGQARNLIRKDDAPTVAQLLGVKIFGELELADHYTAWSMMDYLAQERPEGLACILDAITGLIDDTGAVQSGAINDRLREAFRNCMGLTFQAFDREWRNWLVSPEEG